MYTSTYSSSPVRTTTSETIRTNYQSPLNNHPYNQSSYNNDINTVNDNNNMSLRRNADGYTHSISSLTPTSPRKYPNNYYYSSNDISRSQPTYPSSVHHSYGNNTEIYRSNASRYDLNANNRAYSYDDLLSEQNRSQPSAYNSRYTSQYRQPQRIKPYQYGSYDDEDDDLIVKSTDLPARYEQMMADLVRAAFRKYEITNQRELAGFLKRSADQKFSPCWHCIVGRQFSSYVTHEMNGFIYFTKGPISILLFKSGP